jgi:hypothetical protein
MTRPPAARFSILRLWQGQQSALPQRFLETVVMLPQVSMMYPGW